MASRMDLAGKGGSSESSNALAFSSSVVEWIVKRQWVASAVAFCSLHAFVVYSSTETNGFVRTYLYLSPIAFLSSHLWAILNSTDSKVDTLPNKEDPLETEDSAVSLPTVEQNKFETPDTSKDSLEVDTARQSDHNEKLTEVCHTKETQELSSNSFPVNHPVLAKSQINGFESMLPSSGNALHTDDTFRVSRQGGNNSRPIEAPRREWGVLPPAPTRHLSYSSMNIGDLDEIPSTLASPPLPGLGGPKRLTRHLSCSSSYEMFSSDIDTPLQQALALLSKVRTVVSHIDTEAISVAVADMENEENGKDMRSETSSLYSSPTTRLSGGHFGHTSSPFGSLRRRLSSKGIQDNSVTGSNNTDPLLSTGALNPVSISNTLNKTSYRWSLRRENSGLMRTVEAYEEYDVDDEEEEDDHGMDDFEDDTEAHPRRPSSLLPFDSSNVSGFSPVEAIDQAIEILLNPETLMRPVLRNHGSTSGDQSWLNMVGAISENSMQDHLPPPPQIEYSPTRVRRQRSRLSSDELSSIVVTSTGKLLVESASQLHLSEMAKSGMHDSSSCSEEATSSDTDDAAQHSEGDSPHSRSSTGSPFGASDGNPRTSSENLGEEERESTSSVYSRADNGKDVSLKPQEPENEEVTRQGDQSPPLMQHQDLPQSKPIFTRLYSRSINPPETIRFARLDSGSPKAQITLGQLNDWNFDIIEFANETDDRPLYTLLWAIFSKHNFFAEFKVDRRKFKAFAKEVENTYLPLPYHNSIHATDVLMSIHYLLFSLEMGRVLTSVEKLSAIFAAAIHDIKHPGVNNAFLIKTRSQLSLFYNDQSILEQMHLAEAFRLLAKPELAILENLSPEHWDRFRKLTIRMVLATDLKDHFETVTKLKNLGNRGSELVTANNKELILEVAIKVADVGHAAKDFEVHRKWANRIQEEFFLQGDHELRVGLPVSDFMDRAKADNDRNQQNFFEYIALPLFESVRSVFDGFADIHRQSRRNHGEWKRRVNAHTKATSS